MCRHCAQPRYVTMAARSSDTSAHGVDDALAVFSVEGRSVRSLFTEAGFRDVRVRIEVATSGTVSGGVPRREAASSPLAGLISTLTEHLRSDLIRELQLALSDHVDDEGLVCTIGRTCAGWRGGELPGRV